MRFLRSHQVQFNTADTVFRESERKHLVVTILFRLAGAGLLAAGAVGALPMPLAGLVGGTLLLFSFMSARLLKHARSPANWLLACDGRRALIKFRSYLNEGLAAETPDVLELTLSEVEGVGATHQDLRGFERGPQTVRDSTLFLDLRLKAGASLSELEERLRQERQLRAPGATWRAYPVSVPDDRTVRLEWRSTRTRVIPAIDDALRLLGAVTFPMPARREDVDLSGLGRGPDAPDPMRDVHALAAQGKAMEAIVLARRAFGWDLTQAKRYIDELSKARG